MKKSMVKEKGTRSDVVGHDLIRSKNSIGYNYLIIAGINALLMIIPFFRGLYFRENVIPVISVISAIFVAVVFIYMLCTMDKLKVTYLDMALFGLSFAYFVSLFFGVSKMDALDGALKFAAAFMLYKSVHLVTKEKKSQDILIHGIALSGFITALASLLGSAEVIKIKGVFGFADRLNGLYQYPNATAAVMGAIYLLVMVLLLSLRKRIYRILYFISSSAIILTFLETRSRGGMLVLGLVWLLTLIVLKGKDKLYFIINSGFTSLISVLFYDKIYSTFIQKSGFSGTFAAFLVISAVLGFALDILRKYVGKVSEKLINRLLIAALALLVLGGTFALNLTEPFNLQAGQSGRNYEVYSVKPGMEYNVCFTSESEKNETDNLTVTVSSINKARERAVLYGSKHAIGSKAESMFEFKTNADTMYITIDFINSSTEDNLTVYSAEVYDKVTGKEVEKLKLKYKFIPDDIAKKITEISLKTESSSERFIFIKDGIKMFGDHILFGTGSKGWSHLYNQYQSYAYISREAHNFYIQTAIEAGILGAIFLGMLVIVVLYITYKLCFSANGRSYSAIAILAALFALFAHGFIDFDLSYFSILLLVYVLLGMLSSIADASSIFNKKLELGVVPKYILAFAGVLVFAISVTMYSGIRDANNAAKLVNSDSIKAKALYEKAISKGFYNMSYNMDYSQLLAVEAEQTGNKALVQEVYKNLKLVEKNEPYRIQYYSTLMQVYFRFGYIDEALRLLDKMIEVQPLAAANYEYKAYINYDLIDKYKQVKNYKGALKCVDNILQIEEQHEEANKKTIAPFELTENTKKIIENAKTIKPKIEQNIK